MGSTGTGGTRSVKKHVQELAAFGGKPVFLETRHVGRPSILNREAILSGIADTLDRSWLSNNGQYVQEFERRVAEVTGVRHCIATCNATAALQLVFRALDIRGSVIMPSFTFAATPHAAAWVGAEPVFAECRVGDGNIDPNDVARKIDQSTEAIVGVHLFGAPCDVPALQSLARAHSLRLVFDASHAFACSHQGIPIGTFGDAEVFSFHATKFVFAGEGGAIVTNRTDLAERLRCLRNFGFDADGDVVGTGINAKMSEAAAVTGLAALDSLPELLRINQSNIVQYRRAVRSIPGLQLWSECAAMDDRNWQYVVMMVDADQYGVSRDQLSSLLRPKVC